MRNRKAVEQKEAKGEPEDYVSAALYLLQLVQQDLNMGRKSTVWARVKRAREHLQELEDMFLPKSNKVREHLEGIKPY